MGILMLDKMFGVQENKKLVDLLLERFTFAKVNPETQLRVRDLIDCHLADRCNFSLEFYNKLIFSIEKNPNINGLFLASVYNGFALVTLKSNLIDPAIFYIKKSCQLHKTSNCLLDQAAILFHAERFEDSLNVLNSVSKNDLSKTQQESFNNLHNMLKLKSTVSEH